MRYTRTQIYLHPEDHRRLREEARARGVSLTALIRDIVSSFVSQQRPPPPQGFKPLIGLAEGDLTDITREERHYREAVLDSRLRKKLGGGTQTPDRRRARKAR